jgi:hypothetical protein
VPITSGSPPTITACFTKTHATGTVLIPLGGFATGVVPPSGIANGSSATVLKIYGDINSDGNMVYIEYTCDAAAGSLYRNVMDWNAVAKPAKTPSMVLLNNVIANPGNAPCFTYQTEVVTGNTFVTGVADDVHQFFCNGALAGLVVMQRHFLDQLSCVPCCAVHRRHSSAMFRCS